jgi:two-component system, OmpR family, KDP operon response regulator KdpE
MSSRVLVVDDERPILRALEANLKARGYEVEIAETGERALQVAGQRSLDAVIVDLGLPGITGLDVVRGLRAWSKVPIIILSARHEETEKIAALDAGADDYVTKPFGMGELLARLRAALRRVAPADDLPVVQTPDFRIDLVAKRASTAAGDVHLTPTQWHLVEVLIRNAGKLVSQRQLLQEVWGPQYRDETNYLRVFMAQIRRKLEPDPARPRYFVTEAGMGVRFMAAAEDVNYGDEAPD